MPESRCLTCGVMAKLCSERWMKDRCDRMYFDVLRRESGREQAEYVVCVAGNVG